MAAALGARVGFLGKVAADQLGQVFAHDIRATGVHFPTAPLHGGAPTARCLILVTPDAQRTMNTFLGACVDFSAADVDAEEVARARSSTWKAICSIRRPPRPPSSPPPTRRTRPGGRSR